jgi:hypothetical protein
VRDEALKILFAWYGLYQAGHLVVNARGLALLQAGNSLDFPAPPPAGGWHAQAIAFLASIAVVDVAIAVAGLTCVLGYFRRAHWAVPLGIVSVSASLYAAIVFDAATIITGAWARSLGDYVVVNLLCAPAVMLLVLLFDRARRADCLAASGWAHCAGGRR